MFKYFKVTHYPIQLLIQELNITFSNDFLKR